MGDLVSRLLTVYVLLFHSLPPLTLPCLPGQQKPPQLTQPLERPKQNQEGGREGEGGEEEEEAGEEEEEEGVEKEGVDSQEARDEVAHELEGGREGGREGGKEGK